MHELALAKELFAVVISKSAEKGLEKIDKVKIALGEASGIDPEFLRHSFIDHIFPGTIAEGALLEIALRKVSARCGDCGEPINDFAADECPSCAGREISVESGRDVFIEEIEGIGGKNF